MRVKLNHYQILPFCAFSWLNAFLSFSLIEERKNLAGLTRQNFIAELGERRAFRVYFNHKSPRGASDFRK